MKPRVGGVRSSTEEAVNRINEVTYLSVSEEELYDHMGDMTTVISHSCSGRKFVNAIDICGGFWFLVLRRNSFDIVQQNDQVVEDSHTKSMADLEGTISIAEVGSCSI